MRGLSERAPQFLRDRGEQGGSSHARLWLLPTVLPLIQARLDRPASGHSALSAPTREREKARALQGDFELVCI